MAVVAAGMLNGCNTAPAPKSESETAVLSANTTGAIDSFTAKDSSLQDLLNKSVGYAVFPEVGKAGFVVGGSYGKGEVYEHGRRIGYADVTEASFGLQAGAQSYSELLIFMRQSDLDDFKMGKEYKLAADVSAVALSSGAGKTADPTKGIIAFVDTKGGLMAEAAIGGQRLRFRSE
jgi:lipid-binding SYLF domain-containing protein